MKVCVHRDLVIAVLTRDEHCLPHVHVGTNKWDVRFQFSVGHDSVQLWDVVPTRNAPSVGAASTDGAFRAGFQIAAYRICRQLGGRSAGQELPGASQVKACAPV